jgi:hypothetical protein
MTPEISGEIHSEQNSRINQSADVLPSIIVEEGLGHEQANSVAEYSQDVVSQETEDSLLLVLEAVDDELRQAKTRLRSAQELALKYQSQSDVFSKLNEESKFFQGRYDQLVAKKDQVLAKLKKFKKLV